MLHITETINFFEQQSRMCIKWSQTSATPELTLKYSILADIYLTLASGIKILTTGHRPELEPSATMLPDLEAADENLR